MRARGVNGWRVRLVASPVGTSRQSGRTELTQCGLGVSHSLQSSSLDGSQRDHVSRSVEVGRNRRRVRQFPTGQGAVTSRDTRRHAYISQTKQSACEYRIRVWARWKHALELGVQGRCKE